MFFCFLLRGAPTPSSVLFANAPDFRSVPPPIICSSHMYLVSYFPMWLAFRSHGLLARLARMFSNSLASPPSVAADGAQLLGNMQGLLLLTTFLDAADAPAFSSPIQRCLILALRKTDQTAHEVIRGRSRLPLDRPTQCW